MKTHARLALVTAATALLAGQAGAVMITQIDPVTSFADADWIIDNDPNSSVIRVGVQVGYFRPEMMGSAVMLQFILDPNDRSGTGGARDIYLVNYQDLDDPNATMTNSMGLTWKDFHILVGNVLPILPQYAGASFVDLAGINGEPFGPPASASSSSISFLGAQVPDGSSATIRGIHIRHNNADEGVFYIKLIPTPEPATAALLGIGAAMLVARRRHRSGG